MPEPISEQTVRDVAKLARLSLSDEQVAEQTTKLASILSYIDKLNEVDVDGVEPMAHAMDLQNVFREDVETPGYPTKAILANAPDQDPPFFKVPKVLGDGGGA